MNARTVPHVAARSRRSAEQPELAPDDFRTVAVERQALDYQDVYIEGKPAPLQPPLSRELEDPRSFRVRIHRGATEIGGSAVELESNGSRLVLDLGRPLSSSSDGDFALPTIAGLRGDDETLLGLVITHAHLDHSGLIGGVTAGVPVYAGAATARILEEALFFTGAGAHLRLAGELGDRRPFQIGPFTVTPYLVDHSAFDAYAVLVEAAGRRLFYSGDLRAHGRKGRLMERLVHNPPSNVDVLLLEGTRITETDPSSRGLPSEHSVEEHALHVMNDTSGLVLASFSPQNIDRLVSIYRASLRAGRTFVVDLYAAAIAAATAATIPQASWPNVRVYVPQAQRVRIKKSAAFERLEAVKGRRIYPEELAATPDRFTIIFRESMTAELRRAGCLAGASVIWSMWPGYLETPSGLRLQQTLKQQQIPLLFAHASGHATAADLRRIADAIAAERVVPIHTAAPSAYTAAGISNVEIRRDGETWAV